MKSIPFAGVEDQHAGGVFVLEIIDIANIVELRFFVIQMLEKMLDRAGAAGTGEPGYEYVISDTFYIQAQPDRVNRLFLADYTGQRFDIFGGGNPRRLVINGVVELFIGEFPAGSGAGSFLGGHKILRFSLSFAKYITCYDSKKQNLDRASAITRDSFVYVDRYIHVYDTIRAPYDWLECDDMSGSNRRGALAGHGRVGGTDLLLCIIALV